MVTGAAPDLASHLWLWVQRHLHTHTLQWPAATACSPKSMSREEKCGWTIHHGQGSRSHSHETRTGQDRTGLGWAGLPQEGKSQSTALYCRKAQAGSSEGQGTEETGRSLRTASSKCKIGHTCAWEDTWTELCRQLHAVEGLLCPGWRGMEHSTCPAHAPGCTGLGLKHLGKTYFLSSALGPVLLSLSAGSCSPHRSGSEWKAPLFVLWQPGPPWIYPRKTK